MIGSVPAKDLPPDLTWRKARASTLANCVEVAELADGAVAVRHSRDVAGWVLVFSAAEFAAFLDGAKRGDFDDMAADRVTG